VSQSRWRVASASVRGVSHEKAGLPCQDAHVWACVSDGVLVAAVADGAGSAPLASEGAAKAASTAIEFVSGKLNSHSSPGKTGDEDWSRILTEALGAAKKAIEVEAQSRSVPENHLATTLTIVAAGPDFLAGAQVGDGAIVVADSDGKIRTVAPAAHGEYLNETVFLTCAEALSTAQPEVWRAKLAHLAILSDGLRMVALEMPQGDPHPGFFTPLFRFLEKQPDAGLANEALLSFLRSPRLRERTDDDVTLVLATLLG